MELSPIPGIRAVGPITTKQDVREVQPAFRLGSSERMKDDAYRGARRETERGLEEEDSEAEEPGGSSDIPSNSSDSKDRVNLFA